MESVRSAMSALSSGDAHQKLRITRNLMAAGSSVLVIALLCVYWLENHLALHVFIVSASAISLLILLFFVLFRSHLNMRFRDPSLTMPQIASALVVLVYVNFHLEDGRGAFLLVYIMALLFGVFRLRMRQLVALVVPVLCAHAIMVARRPLDNIDSVQLELLHWVVLSIVLLWFVPLGNYISNMRSRLGSLAMRDELTGTKNRRHMIEVLAAEKARADRHRNTFAVALLDLDRFKGINDEYGHGAGDVVLQDFGSVIAAAVRRSDHFGRYGGEEFMVVLPATNTTAALQVLERIRLRCAQPDLASFLPWRIAIARATGQHAVCTPARSPHNPREGPAARNERIDFPIGSSRDSTRSS